MCELPAGNDHEPQRGYAVYSRQRRRLVLGAGPSANLTLNGLPGGSGTNLAYATANSVAGPTNTSGLFTFTVATPTFTNAWGADNTGVTVSAATATANATVTYTTDGSQPTSGGSQVPPTITSSSTTVKAGAFKSGYANSAVSSTNFQAAAMPTFSPPGWTFNSPQTVTIYTNEPGATVKYSLDGGACLAGSHRTGGHQPDQHAASL